MTLEERVLRVPEAAALLGVSASTYYAAAGRGEVPAIRVGRRLVVPGAALARLLEGAPRPEGAITGRIGGVYGRRSRCPAHTSQSSSRWAQYAAEHPDRASFYRSGAWRERRARHLADNPDCVVCGQPATAADHIVNLASGGTFDGPLQSLCTEHHRRKTQAESKLGNKRAAARRRRGQ